MRSLALSSAIAVAAAALPASQAHAQQARAGERADFVLVDKSDRKLWVYQGGRVIRSYSGLQYGDRPMGHKRFQGDERTPEGRYTITYGNEQSSFYLSLHIDYPNARDRAYARARGRSPGGLIFIHGQPNAVKGLRTLPGDWTAGCIAVADTVIEELWRIAPIGTEVVIRP